jgi:hypothetical protein
MELDPLAMIEAQRDRIRALTDENVQLTAAVRMLQKQVGVLQDEELREMENRIDNGEVQLDPDATQYIQDVTDEVVGAEMDPRAEITS